MDENEQNNNQTEQLADLSLTDEQADQLTDLPVTDKQAEQAKGGGAIYLWVRRADLPSN